MQGIRTFIAAALRGPAGGMLACVLLAAMLGGIAMANPEDWGGPDSTLGIPRGAAAHGGGTAEVRSEAGEQGGGVNDRRGRAGVERGRLSDADVADCRVALVRFRGDLPSADLGLARALDVVSENCRRHLLAPGLRHAVERLMENARRRTAGGSPAVSPGVSPSVPDRAGGGVGPDPPHQGRPEPDIEDIQGSTPGEQRGGSGSSR